MSIFFRIFAGDFNYTDFGNNRNDKHYGQYTQCTRNGSNHHQGSR